jgi:hypothetical protein
VDSRDKPGHDVVVKGRDFRALIIFVKQVGPGYIGKNGKYLGLKLIVSAVEYCYGQEHSFPCTDQPFITIKI